MSRVRLLIVVPSGHEHMFGDGRRIGIAGTGTTGGVTWTVGLSAIGKVLDRHDNTQHIRHGRRISEGTRGPPVQKTLVTVNEYGIVGRTTRYEQFREDGKLPWRNSPSR